MRRLTALSRAMFSARARRLDRREAEVLLSRGSSHADRAGLVNLLDLAAAPAQREELAGRDAAVAEFVRLRRATPLAAPRRRRLRAWLSRALVVKAAVGLTVLLLGGVAFAAGTGQLPAEVQHGAHDLLTPFGVPVPDGSSPSAKSARPHPVRPSRTPSAAPGADLRDMCETWQAGQKHGHGKDLDPALVARLGAAAGGTDKIADFCTALLAATPGPSTTPTQPAPTPPGNPDKTHGRPSKKPHP
jgi:hypothetical protein